jgi:oligopeptide transport system ATP-binding protein
VRERIVLRGDLPSPTQPIDGCRFHTRCPFAMDICRTVAPQPYAAPDGAVVECHLHTEGPQLAGRSVTELEPPAASVAVGLAGFGAEPSSRRAARGRNLLRRG